MLGLQFISLLLSKEKPSHVGSTLSPELRDMVGIGTLGASKLKDSNITEARIKDDYAVIVGWQLMGIEYMVNTVNEAAERMEKEIELETKFWNDICQIREERYHVFEHPQNPQSLAVRFNSSESAQWHHDQCIGGLRRSDDGTVRLVTGPIGLGHKQVRVTVMVNGKITGRTPVLRRLAESAPIQDQIHAARATSTNQELWHEINREARSLLSLGVIADQSSVTCNLTPRVKVTFTLEEMANEQFESTEIDLPHNTEADLVDWIMTSLLTHAHEDNYQRRKYPQSPAPNRTNPYPIYLLLRPLIAHARYLDGYAGLVSFLDQLVDLLRRAGATTAAYSKFSSQTGRPPHIPAERWNYAGEFLANQVMYTMELALHVIMTPDASVQIRSATHPMPYVAHRFAVVLPPSGAQQQNGTNGSGNPTAIGNNNNIQEQQQQLQQHPPQPQLPSLLESAYPPSSDPYHNHHSVIEYFKNAAPRALAAHLAASAQRRAMDQMRDVDDDSTIMWIETMRGPAVTIDSHPEREVYVNFYFEEGGVGNGAYGDSEDSEDDEEPQRHKRCLVLKLDGRWIGTVAGSGGKGSVRQCTGSWVWRPFAPSGVDRHGAAIQESPEDIVWSVLMAGEM